MSAEHYLHHDADTRALIAEAEVRGAVEALHYARLAFAGEDTVEWARKAHRSHVSLPYAIELLDDLIATATAASEAIETAHSPPSSTPPRGWATGRSRRCCAERTVMRWANETGDES